MKWAKSRKVKNSLSPSRSLGTPASGWRAASSETIRGDADPTWWTCSSALGRPAMKGWRLTPRSVVSPGVSRPNRPSPRRCRRCVWPSTSLAVDEDRRGGVDAGLGGGVVGRVDPALERHVLDPGTYVGLGRAGLDGQVDEVVGVGERARTPTAGCRRAGRGTPWPPRDRTRRARRRTRWRTRASSRRSARGTERAVLDADLAGLDRGVELVAHGQLELTAEGAEEVLVDHDLLGGVGVADDAGRSCRSRRPAGCRACPSPGW